jgi:hypothetical protein
MKTQQFRFFKTLFYEVTLVQHIEIESLTLLPHSGLIVF